VQSISSNDVLSFPVAGKRKKCFVHARAWISSINGCVELTIESASKLPHVENQDLTRPLVPAESQQFPPDIEK
jgi:hypothetical protein